jgi:hypothetical protein
VRLSRPSSVKPHLRCYSVVGSSALTAVVVNCPYGASITFVAGEAERHEANKNRLPFRLMELGSGFRAICSRVLSPKINNRHEFSTRHWMAASAPLQQPVRPALWLRPSLESLSTNPDGDDDDDDDDDNDKRRVTCCTCNVVAFKSGGGIRSEVLPRIPIVPGCLHRYLSTDTIVAINHVPLFRGFAGATLLRRVAPVALDVTKQAVTYAPFRQHLPVERGRRKRKRNSPCNKTKLGRTLSATHSHSRCNRDPGRSRGIFEVTSH